MADFGTLKAVDLRMIWPSEPYNFTLWIAENIEALGEAIGMDIELIEAEADAGDFSLDVLARDLGTGRHVVIENQLTSTDHDHLGKLLTYASAFDAAAVIWVSQAIRDEHRQALEWLNQRTVEDTNFFGVAIEVLQIDDSRPAFNFKPIVFPNEWKKGNASSATKGVSSRGEAYRQFFQSLIDELREKHKFTSARVGQPQNWYSFTSGVSGCPYGASFAQGDKIRTELYIDRRDAALNKAAFDQLKSLSVELEAAFGEPLEWERLDDRRASRIASYFPGSITAPPEELALIRAQVVDRLLRFKKVFGPVLPKAFAAIGPSFTLPT